VICPGGAAFETSSARGKQGAGVVSNATRPGMTIRRSDEIRLPEWSGEPGGEERAHKRSAGRLDAEWRLPGWVTTNESDAPESGALILGAYLIFVYASNFSK